ncbi:hypothetical protein H6B13_03490 [Bacteroides gallinaceum]|uniref:hypothetical protein n=1 Tax=Bacteroides gallinaceum TaxID=1462571 RepID=UPI00195BA6E8|nr:hypothetical protein [Bacteroides gallinaceum]MBM6718707.1 hypothetical protein [Bacteroides gallinaceum]
MNTSQQSVINTPFPLLMHYTSSTPIQESEDRPIVYNDQLQITEYDARIVGTRSLKSSVTTKKVNGLMKTMTDRKNEIDDQKSVL